MNNPKYILSKQYPQKRVFVARPFNQVGRAICLQLAADGWVIGLSSTNEEQLQEMCHEIDMAGGTAIGCLGDISKVEQYEAVSNKFFRDAGGIDLLINNTGIDENSILGDFSIEAWITLIATHQMAVVFGCHFFLPYMIQKKMGYVINIACSADADSGAKAPYEMAKGAVLSISETIKTKFSESNIGITVALPIYFKTKVNQNSQSQQLIIDLDRPIEVWRILQAAGEQKFCIY